MWEWPWLDVLYYSEMIVQQAEESAMRQAQWISMATWDAKQFREESERLLGTEDTRTGPEIIRDTILSDDRRRGGGR